MSGQLTILNNTVTGNTAMVAVLRLAWENTADADIQNNIIWGNMGMVPDVANRHSLLSDPASESDRCTGPSGLTTTTWWWRTYGQAIPVPHPFMEYTTSTALAALCGCITQ